MGPLSLIIPRGIIMEGGGGACVKQAPVLFTGYRGNIATWGRCAVKRTELARSTSRIHSTEGGLFSYEIGQYNSFIRNTFFSQILCIFFLNSRMLWFTFSIADEMVTLVPKLSVHGPKILD